MQSKKLYFDNSYLKHFSANVLEVNKYKDKFSVILDETAFYPESGGQPADKGFIANIPVLNVIDDKGVILHILESPVPIQKVNCSIDWQLRFEHMQQHTGQHILSACFYKLYGGNTSSFTIGKESSTIEIDIPNFDDNNANQLEDMANNIIYSNFSIKANIFEKNALKNIPLRKVPKVDTNIRVVEIENTDFSPCGGTHVSSTGEIGIIKIKRWEKLKSSYKFEFVCGVRALKDYRSKNTTIYNLGSLLSARDYEVEDYFYKSIEAQKNLQKDYSLVKQELLSYEAERLIGTAINIKNVSIVSKLFKDRDINDLKLLSHIIIKRKSFVVLFAVQNQNTQLLFSCSDDLLFNMGSLLKSVVSLIDGKGGGNNKIAQGGGSKSEAVTQLMCRAKQLLIEQI